jgi:hypothetical protein
MARKQKLNQITKPKRTPPRNVVEWNALLKKSIARAEGLKDRRTEGLRAALSTNRSEVVLRRMGIITEKDILREFPTK